MKSFALAAVLALASNSAFAAELSPAEARGHVGETATVEGIVSEVFTSRRGDTFLDFGGRYPDETFTAVIFRDDANVFGDLHALEGKRVDVRGRIRSYRGRPEIILRSNEQLKEN